MSAWSLTKLGRETRDKGREWTRKVCISFEGEMNALPGEIHDIHIFVLS